MRQEKDRKNIVENDEELSELESAIFYKFRDCGPLSSAQLACDLLVTNEEIMKALIDLEQKGYVEKREVEKYLTFTEAYQPWGLKTTSNKTKGEGVSDEDVLEFGARTSKLQKIFDWVGNWMK